MARVSPGLFAPVALALIAAGCQDMPLPEAAMHMPAPVAGSPAAPVAVKAAIGGAVVSADGSLEAVIPPGALSADAVVTLQRLDTAAMPVTDLLTPGLAFKADFGGAVIKPGATVMVKGPADDRFVQALMAQGEDLGARGLTQRDGRWYVSMPVRAETEAIDAMPLKRGSLVEVGPVTPAAQRRILASASPAYPIINTVSVTIGGFSGTFRMGYTVRDTLAMAGDAFYCYVSPACTEVFAALNDVVTYNRTVGSGQTPPAALLAKMQNGFSVSCGSLTIPVGLNTGASPGVRISAAPTPTPSPTPTRSATPTPTPTPTPSSTTGSVSSATLVAVSGRVFDAGGVLVAPGATLRFRGLGPSGMPTATSVTVTATGYTFPALPTRELIEVTLVRSGLPDLIQQVDVTAPSNTFDLRFPAAGTFTPAP